MKKFRNFELVKLTALNGLDILEYECKFSTCNLKMYMYVFYENDIVAMNIQQELGYVKEEDMFEARMAICDLLEAYENDPMFSNFNYYIDAAHADNYFNQDFLALEMKTIDVDDLVLKCSDLEEEFYCTGDCSSCNCCCCKFDCNFDEDIWNEITYGLDDDYCELDCTNNYAYNELFEEFEDDELPF